MRNGVRVYVTVMSPGSATTPLTDEARADFASYAAAIVRERPVDRARDHRQRAEPEPLLAAAVRPRRLERRARGVPRAPRADVRRAQGRLARRAGLRRRRLSARQRPSGRHPADPLADAVHPGARHSPIARAAATGRVMDAFVDPPLRGQLQPVAADGRPPTHHDDRRGRLREARRASSARRSTAPRRPGSDAADPLRRVRRRVADPGGEGSRCTPGPSRRRRSRSTRRRRPRTTSRRSRSRSVSRPSAGCCSSSRATSARERRGSRGSTTSTARRRRAAPA